MIGTRICFSHNFSKKIIDIHMILSFLWGLLFCQIATVRRFSVEIGFFVELSIYQAMGRNVRGYQYRNVTEHVQQGLLKSK